jgi:hypothetical protein
MVLEGSFDVVDAFDNSWAKVFIRACHKGVGGSFKALRMVC